MKSNIDLTMDRMFHNNNRDILSINMRNKLEFRELFAIFDKEDTNNEDENEILFTGSKQTRKVKKMMFEYNNNEIDHCIRCGNLKFPYENNKELCRNCEEELEKEFKYDPFKNFD